MNALERKNRQFLNWERFCNNKIGMLAFGFALGSLSTSNPTLCATASLLILVALMKDGPAPEIMRMLEIKLHRTKTEEQTRLLLKSEHYGIKSMFTNYAVYFMGMGSLIIVMAFPKLL